MFLEVFDIIALVGDWSKFRDCDFARVFDVFSKGQCSLACSNALFLACVVFSKSKKSCVFDGSMCGVIKKSCVFVGFVNGIVKMS